MYTIIYLFSKKIDHFFLDILYNAFMKSHNIHTNTIAALATPYGTSAIAIIRISGQETFAIMSKILNKKIQNHQSHKAFVAKIYDDAATDIIDEVMILPSFSPRSYTGEDSAEIHSHGNMLIVQKILNRLYELGASPANPGEFTYRAYLNGKLDLAQAEAVGKIIHSKNQTSLTVAQKELNGYFKSTLDKWTRVLYKACAHINAWIDYPEDVTPENSQLMLDKLNTLSHDMQSLHATYLQSKKIEDGFAVVLSGSPNTGKSSLLNALLMRNRAIVSNIAGTTRDYIEEELHLGPCHIRIIDTAGIRQTTDTIEHIGVQQSREFSSKADLNLVVFDASSPPTDDEINHFKALNPNQRLAIWNKEDISTNHIIDSLKPAVCISATKQTNIETLKSTIAKLLVPITSDDKQHLITSQRHYNILSNAITSLNRAIGNIKNNASAEFIQFDLTETVHIIAQLTGDDANERILDEIFSEFCVGK